MANFYVSIITPQKIILEGDFYMALLPLYEGEVGIMADHVNYGSLIMPGLLKLFTAEGVVSHEMLISGGIIDFLDGKLTILADKIVDLCDITHEEISQKIDEITRKLEDKDLEIDTIEHLYKELNLYNQIHSKNDN